MQKCLGVLSALLMLALIFGAEALAMGSDLTNPEAMNNYFDIAKSAVIFASVIANKTNSASANKYVAWFGKAVNLIAGNWFMFFRPRKK